MKKIILGVLLLGTVTGYSQSMEGMITYEKVSHWSKILDKLTFLSEEERSRSKTSWGSMDDDGDKSRGNLFITSSKSKYLDVEMENEGGYSGRNREYVIMHDYDTEKILEIEEFSGKTYIIEDRLVTPKWKVHNKIKEVNGYMCMMATSEDTLKGQKIEAWFANDIASSAGPERYFGLPGLIMEINVNEGEVIITAVKVEKKSVSEDILPPKKLKGKKINQQQYNKMIADFVRDSMAAHRNPFWVIRY